MAYKIMAYIRMAYMLMVYIVMTYMVIAHMVMAHVLTAYIVLAYIISYGIVYTPDRKTCAGMCTDMCAGICAGMGDRHEAALTISSVQSLRAWRCRVEPSDASSAAGACTRHLYVAPAAVLSIVMISACADGTGSTFAVPSAEVRRPA